MPRGMLPSMKLAGLDIGTTTISGLVLDPESGQVDEVMTEPNDASISGKAPWEVLQDPVAILRTAKRFTSAFLDRHRDVSAVGITGQMHGILYVDPKGRAVSPLITWQDRRGEQLDESGVSFASRVAAAAGRQASTGMGSVTHYYNVPTGQVPEDASALCTIADYVAMGLTGTPAPVIDATNAASLGCFDVRSLRFRTDVLESLGIDPGLFPRVDTSYPALGEIRRGVPVFVALGDNQAGFLGSSRTWAVRCSRTSEREASSPSRSSTAPTSRASTFVRSLSAATSAWERRCAAAGSTLSCAIFLRVRFGCSVPGTRWPTGAS